MLNSCIKPLLKTALCL